MHQVYQESLTTIEATELKNKTVEQISNQQQ